MLGIALKVKTLDKLLNFHRKKKLSCEEEQEVMEEKVLRKPWRVKGHCLYDL